MSRYRSSLKEPRRSPPGTATGTIGTGVKSPPSEPPQGTADPLASHLPRALLWGHGKAVTVLAGVAVLAFLNSLWNGFAMDDNFLIVTNRLVHSLGNLKAMFTRPYWPEEYMDGMYRPVLVISFALNHLFSGLRPFAYHLVNILLHAANSALAYALAWQLFRQRGLALLAGAAFALHPIHTEAVANIVGRGEMLAATFAFIAWLLYLQREQGSPPASGRRSLLLAGSVGGFALGLLSKEHVIVLPGLLLLSDTLLATRRMPAFSLAALGRALWTRCLTAYPAYLVVAGAYLLVRTAVLGTFKLQRILWVLNPIAYSDAATRLLTAVKVLGRYLWLLAAPVTLSADYSYNEVPVATSLLDPDVLLPLPAVGIIAWILRRRAPAVPFGLAVFLVAILPVSNLLFPIGSIMAERQLYLPSFGFCISLAGLVALAVERLAAHGTPRWLQSVPVGLFALILAFYAGKTVYRNPAWASDLAIWRETTMTSPNSAKAHYSLARSLVQTGDLEGAKEAMATAIRIYPQWGEAQRWLGVILSAQGRWDEAIAAHLASISLDPQHPEPHYNLAKAYERKSQIPDARRAFERAAELALLWNRPRLFLGIGDFLVRHGELPEAERSFERATRSWPTFVDGHLYLGYVYWKRGRLTEAKAAFERALELDPGSAKGHEGMGLVLRSQGHETEAQREFALAGRHARHAPEPPRDARPAGGP